MAEQLGDLESHPHLRRAAPRATSAPTVVLLGWVHRVRDWAACSFIDIRDRDGVSQVVVRDERARCMAVAKRLRSEFVIGVSGVVQRRSAETVNPKLADRRGRGRWRARSGC